MKIIGVIPARYASSRFPGKPLATINGKPMIQHVYERAVQSETISEVIIATDDNRIFEACEGFNAKVMMTSVEHESGSDRVAEIAEKTDGDIYINIQGDEPMLPPENIDIAVQPLLEDKSVLMSTLKTDISDVEEIFDVNKVKVITDSSDNALYFSRLPIPFIREPETNYLNYPELITKKTVFSKYFHIQIGLYVFRRDFLFTFTKLPPSNLETLEKLEQLRALENGYKIKAIYTKHSSWGVDSPEDLDKIISLIEEGKNGN